MTERGSKSDGLERIPYSRIRAATARRLTESVTTKPHVTLHGHASGEALFATASWLRSDGVDQVRLIHLLVRVLASALVEIPTLNGWVQNGTLLRAQEANVGIAVQTEGCR